MLEVDEISKACIKKRYVKLLQQYESRLWKTSLLFYGAQVTMQVGSLLTPALLTYRSQDLEDITWGVALGTGVVTSLFNVFAIGKKYASLVQTYSLLCAEGSLFLQCTGRYAQHSRFEACNAFIERIEMLHSKFVKKDVSALQPGRSTYRATRVGNDNKVSTPLSEVATSEQKEDLSETLGALPSRGG